MKKFCLLFVLLLALIMSGCEKSQDTSGIDVTSGNESVPDEQDEQINSEITQEKAAVLLNDYLQTIGISKDNDPNLVITLDRTDEAKGQEYFVFQVFDDMNDHTATIGWYGVQKEDGSLYDFVLMKEITTLDNTKRN